MKFLFKLKTSESINCQIFWECILPIFIKSIKCKWTVDLLISYVVNSSYELDKSTSMFVEATHGAIIQVELP